MRNNRCFQYLHRDGGHLWHETSQILVVHDRKPAPHSFLQGVLERRYLDSTLLNERVEKRP